MTDLAIPIRPQYVYHETAEEPIQFGSNEGPPKIREIVKAVAQYYAVPAVEIIAQRRLKCIVKPRHMVFYLARQLTYRSFPDIGHILNRDHTTVLFGARKIAKCLESDVQLRLDVAAITALIFAGDGP